MGKQEYGALCRKIKAAQTRGELDRIDASVDRIYDAGVLTVPQASRLYVKTMERAAILEMESNQ